MADDILMRTAATAPKPPAGYKLSVVGVLVVIILAIVLILIGERLLFDLNRWINPVITWSGVNDYNDYGYKQMPMMSFEKNAMAPGMSIQYPTSDKGDYLAYKLLIHSALIVPVFLLVFLLYYAVKIKERKEGWRAAIYAYMAFGFWMMLHLLLEAFGYVMSQYSNIAIYVVLVFMALILTPLAILLQRKHGEQAAG